MTSSILKTRDRIRKAREHPRLLAKVHHLEATLRDKTQVIDRLENRLLIYSSTRMDRDYLGQKLTLCVSIEERALEQNPEAVIGDAMHQLAQGFRQRARR